MLIPRIAQLGVGYWGPNLLRNLVMEQACDLCLVVDVSAERRAFVKSMYPSIEVSGCIEDALSADIDALVIATPAATHCELAVRGLEAGKHVLVEKPLARTVEQVDQIAGLARERNRVAMVGHTFLYNEAVRRLRKLVQSGELGDIRYIYSQRLNLGRIRQDVNVVWNLAPHDVSIVHYLLEEPEPVDVSCRGMAYVQDGVDDVAFMNITYPGGIIVNIHVSWLDPRKVRQTTVVGSQKMVVYDDMSEHKLAILDKGIDKMAVLGENMDFDRPAFPDFTYRSGDVLLPRIEVKEPLNVEIRHFIDCMTTGTSCISGTDHARRVVDVLARTSR